LWWSITKNISGLSKTHNRSAPDVDDLASFLQKTLSLSPDVDSSLSFIPLESGVVCKKALEGYKLSSVCSVMHSLDVTKAVVPDGVSPYILKCP